MCCVVSPKIVYNVNICVFKWLLTTKDDFFFLTESTEITVKTEKKKLKYIYIYKQYIRVEYYTHCGESGKCPL